MLYEDESIVNRSREAGGRFPDINAAVREMAKVNGFTLEQVIHYYRIGGPN